MFERPALETLIDRTRADVLSRLATDDVLRHSDAEVLARAEAGAVHGLYGYLAYVYQELFVTTAQDTLENHHGSQWGVPRNQASKAIGTAVLTAVVGSVVDAGKLLQKADGTQYETTASSTAVTTSLTVPVRAVVAGEAGNCAASTPLSLVNPIDGVQSSAVAGEISGGADIEDIEAYRTRILDRIQEAPQGGDADDYVAWAKEVSGVTRAWCSPEELGPGTVTVRFVRDDDTASIIPDAGEVSSVASYIAARRPVTAQVTVVAPIAVTQNFSISGLNPATATVKSAIDSALRALLRREAQPGATLLISHIREAISTAAGEYDHALTSPSADVVFSTGQMPVMGTITWL